MESKGMMAMRKARAQLYQQDGFYGILALELQLIEDPNCDTAWTDGIHIGFNPDVMLAMSDYDRLFVYKHEVWHVLMGHHLRREGRDVRDWNEAGDRVIHSNFVHREGMRLIEGVLYDRSDLGQSIEMVFGKIQAGKKANQNGQPKNQPQQGQGQPGQGQGQGQGQPEQPQDQSEGQGQGKGQPQDKDTTTGQGDSSSPAKKGKDVGEVRDLPSAVPGQDASKAEQNLNEAKWTQALERAVKEGTQRGTVPGWAVDLLESKKQNLVDWKEVLNRFLKDIFEADDYTFARPNKRFGHSDFILPALDKSQELGTIVFAIDTSGSMYEPALQQAVSELNSILEDYKVKVVVVLCDTKVHKTITFEPDDMPVKVEAVGRGGTSFVPVFDWVLENMEEEPTALLYYTDGDGEFPRNEPQYPVLWLGTRYFRPMFGEFVPVLDC